MWAQVSMTPFSQYKAWLAEGGIRNQLIVSGAAVQRAPGSINRGLMYVADLMPTLLELAHTSYPRTYEGRELPGLIGKSWAPTLSGAAESPRSDRDVLAWELFGNRAVRQGDWKLRWEYKPFGKETWELFNLAEDPAERNDLAAAHPDRVRALVAEWDAYARANNVIVPSRSPFETLEEQLPPRVPDDPGYPPVNYKRQFVPPADLLADPKP
jgi:arylsulfatase